MIKGIDVSSHQGRIDWQRVKADDIRFVLIKATEGVGFVDPNLSANTAGAKSVGLPCGFYHFARPDTQSGRTVESAIGDAQAEADSLLAVAFPTSGDLLPVLDLETAGLPPARMVAWTRAWLERVAERIGVKPLLYTFPGFWGKLGNTTEFGSYPLWVAHWRVSAPQLPRGWRRHTIWQYADDGHVDGISGRVDLNRLHERATLADITYKPKEVKPAPGPRPSQNLPGPVPKPPWFGSWLRWQLGVGEFEGLAQNPSVRPDEAPLEVPGWALACEKKLRTARTSS
ncbi:MAG: Lysozyme [Thermoleophilia bacterium]|nr:Lysozyme [Thermoleophilia bacterium]